MVYEAKSFQKRRDDHILRSCSQIRQDGNHTCSETAGRESVSLLNQHVFFCVQAGRAALGGADQQVVWQLADPRVGHVSFH